MVNVIKGSAGQGQVSLFTFFVILISRKTLKCPGERVPVRFDQLKVSWKEYDHKIDLFGEDSVLVLSYIKYESTSACKQ